MAKIKAAALSRLEAIYRHFVAEERWNLLLILGIDRSGWKMQIYFFLFKK